MAGESGDADQINYTGVWLGDRYLLKDLRAQGGLCAVYRGEDTVLRRPVAIKVAPARWEEMYRASLRATATLAHPAAITPYDALQQDGQLFLAQEYLVAQPLGAYLREGAPVRRALDLTAQIARALAYAHQREILHGDLTPAAVLVDKRATARVNNFGLPPDDVYFDTLALAVARSEQIASTASPADPLDLADAPTLGGRLGAEAALGSWGRGEPAGDVWAVGLLLWLLVTVPVVDDDANALPASATPEPGLASARAFRPETPQDLRALTRSCILPNHPQRITTADALVGALEDLAHALEQERPQPAAPTPRALLAARAAARREAERAARAALASLKSPWTPDAPTDPLPYEPFDAGATRAASDFAASNVGIGSPNAPVAQRPASPPPLPSVGPRLRLPSRPIPADNGAPGGGGRIHSSFSAPTAPERTAWGASAHNGYARSDLLGADDESNGPVWQRNASPYAPYQPYVGRVDGAAPGARRGLGLAAWLLIGLLVFILFFVVGYLLPPLTSLFH